MQEATRSEATPFVLIPVAIGRALGYVACVLVLASGAGQWIKYGFGHPTVRGFVPMFDVSGEENIPSFFPPQCYSSALSRC